MEGAHEALAVDLGGREGDLRLVRIGIRALDLARDPAQFRTLSMLSRNRLTSAYSEVTIVIRKPENRFARII